MKKFLLFCGIFAATAITANAQSPDLNINNNTVYDFEVVPHGENTGCGFTYKTPTFVSLPASTPIHYTDVTAAGLVDGFGNPINATGQFTYVQVTPVTPGCPSLPSTMVGPCGTTTTNISVYDGSCNIQTVNINVGANSVDIN